MEALRVCGFISGLIAKVAAAASGGGWGQPGLEKQRFAGQTGSLPVTYANVYRRLAVLGRGSVARISAELDLPSLPVRSSLTCVLGNTEIPTYLIPTIPYPLHLNLAWTIEVPGQFYYVPGEAWLSSAVLTATSLPCHEIVMAWFRSASSFLSLMPLGCILAMTHLRASTLLQLRKKPSVIIKCRKK